MSELFASKFNTKNAQLIFTTHNPLFVSEYYSNLRPDQIFFTQFQYPRSLDDSTIEEATRYSNLISLAEFKDIHLVDVLDCYISGRFPDTVPFISEELDTTNETQKTNSDEQCYGCLTSGSVSVHP